MRVVIACLATIYAVPLAAHTTSWEAQLLAEPETITPNRGLV